MDYAIVHAVLNDGTEHDFSMKNDKELGATLNYLQGSIFNGTVISVNVIPIAEEAKFKAEAFGRLSGNLENCQKVSKIIRGVE